MYCISSPRYIKIRCVLLLKKSKQTAYYIFLTVCRKYNDMLSVKKTPHVVLDFTMTGVGSETIKSFTAALALPTVTGSFGQAGDLRQWRTLNANQTKFLLQVMPPSDILPEAIRAIVTKQDTTNAAIIFDEYFGLYLLFDVFQTLK